MPRIRFCKAPWEAFERLDGTHEACVCAHPNLSVNARGLAVRSGERIADCLAPADPDGESAMLRDAVNVMFGNVRRARHRVRRVCLHTSSGLRALLYRMMRGVVRVCLTIIDIIV